MQKLSALLFAVVLVLAAVSSAAAQEELETGSVIFFHPDGAGLNHWSAARMYWSGPDGALHWDRLPELALYRGHLRDRLTGTSNGGATVHAFGYKVVGSGSFGRDSGSDDTVGGAVSETVGGAEGRAIEALSGFSGSILREAAAAGMPVGAVNDGDLAEPGTGAFLAEVSDRDDAVEIVRQMLDGRPGFEGEALPKVLLGGGEAFFLPADTPACATADLVTLACYLHRDPVSGRGPARKDGRNLLIEASVLGYEVLRTRAEFDALWARIQAEPDFAPMVLGLFARDDIFNDATEERLIALGLVADNMAAASETAASETAASETAASETADNTLAAKDGRLIIWGSRSGEPGFNPPTAAEMNALALEVLRRHSALTGKPFYLVSEVESVDNLANNANAIGALRAVKAADDAIGVLRAFVAANPQTLLLVAADSDAGGLQLFSPPPIADARVAVSGGNPTGFGLNQGFALDGIEGQNTAPFRAAPDAFGNVLEFAIGWVGTEDVAGAIVSRAEGLNAGLLRTQFGVRFDNTDVYRLQYATLFGELPPPSSGQQAPTR